MTDGGMRNGLDELLVPERSVLLLIDHQGAQFSGLQSHDGNLVINNATALAKGARQFGVPTILTTVVVPVTAGTVLGEWQRDWARAETVPGLTDIFLAHGGNFGRGLAWEFQLLNNTPR